MLILVSTPIGNLQDISFRALEALKNADLILCEDTRHSLRLLQHYDIKKSLQSYHKFNEQEKIEPLLDRLKEGQSICLISDAGTPLISDPGHPLVDACIQADIPVTAIPGPSALLHALVCSGMPTDRFQFIGFLPKKDKELRALLSELTTYPGVTICYESPHRIESTVTLIQEIAPQAPLCIARELTKKFETFLRGKAENLIPRLKDIKGECVLLIHGKKAEQNFEDISLEEHVQQIQDSYQVSKRDAIKIVADLRGIPKRDLYNSFH